ILSTPFRLEVPRRLYEELVAQALAELPNECCGVLAGTVAGGVGRVVKRYPLVNALASPVTYDAEPRGLFAAFKDMRRLELQGLALCHSRRMSAPVPSRMALARAFWPGAVMLIVSLAGREAVVRGWWMTEQDYREAEWAITDAPDP